MCSTPTTKNDLGLTDKNSGCACGGHSHVQSDVQRHDQTAGPVIREHYSVNGMTCGHCVSSVTKNSPASRVCRASASTSTPAAPLG